MNEKKGDVFGVNKHIFIKELDKAVFNRNVKGKTYDLKVRMGLFQCGLCGGEIKAQITAIKNSRTLSCGCYRDMKIREYHNKRLKSEAN